MTATQSIDSEEIWRRVGLEELRHTLTQAEDSIQGFQQALHALPPCNDCARAALLAHIERAGHQLGKDVISLAVVAEALKVAMVMVEQTQATLIANAPRPCHCFEGPCTCHS